MLCRQSETYPYNRFFGTSPFNPGAVVSELPTNGELTNDGSTVW